MKLKNIAYIAMMMLAPIALASCSDDDEPSTHTDASQNVGGTFSGYVVNADNETIASDVVVTISKLESSNTQAVNIQIQSETLGMDQTGAFNVAKAGNDRYLFASGGVDGKTTGNNDKSAGVLENNSLSLYLVLNKTYKFTTASAGKQYNFYCTKTGE